eukprot:TRINITY_DN22001_c0_g1_i1.p1 TRINITY_DN22001_c0_g1~~TRINITY_DN22001_c0_g1_i1.p1  ORF type:complete len:313 (-),score=29.27 TRINITY_DN22001_c0_g1_i1:54-992(-)
MTMLLVLSICLTFLSVAQCAMTASDRTEILNLHNSVRGCFQEKPLSWNFALETAAQNWANKCNFAHNDNRKADYSSAGGNQSSVGENISMGGSSAGGYTMSQLFAGWWSERSQYTCGTKISSTNYVQFGHYTQILWSDTTTLGCGVALCNRQNFLVCDYATSGNFINQLPYPTTSCTSATCTPSTGAAVASSTSTSRSPTTSQSTTSRSTTSRSPSTTSTSQSRSTTSTFTSQAPSATTSRSPSVIATTSFATTSRSNPGTSSSITTSTSSSETKVSSANSTLTDGTIEFASDAPISISSMALIALVLLFAH